MNNALSGLFKPKLKFPVYTHYILLSFLLIFKIYIYNLARFGAFIAAIAFHIPFRDVNLRQVANESGNDIANALRTLIVRFYTTSKISYTYSSMALAYIQFKSELSKTR